MMEASTFELFRFGLVNYALLVCSVAVHEWAHAFTADKLKDPLPRTQGRVTLNPLAHIDMFGTVLIPLLALFFPLFLGAGSKLVLIGWGKPVEISLPNSKTARRDDILVSSAGPLSNLCVCLTLAALRGCLFKFNTGFHYVELLDFAIFLNAALFIFNLIPIPPLDGSHFLKYLFAIKEETFLALSRWGFFIFLFLINFPPFRFAFNKAIFYIIKFSEQITVVITRIGG